MPLSGRVLLIDDDAEIRVSVGEAITDWGADLSLAASAEEALTTSAGTTPDVVITDVRMGGMSGLELLRVLRERMPSADVVLMTAFDDMATVVSAMKDGAVEFLVKPLDMHQLRALLERLFEDRRTRRASLVPSRELVAWDQMVGRDARMIEIYKRMGQAAASRATVLVRGESGTGKELIARGVHFNSSTASEPFVPVNCTALPSTLLESELFGHTRGAFTGAVAARRGCFAVAGRGTVFLDEIGDTTLEFQSKLLRVLQTHEFQAVGAERTEKTEARVIAATHRDLEALVKAGLFREDLYYRLRVVEIVIPPLRDRVSDIPLLVEHLINVSARAVEVSPPVMSDDALAILVAHRWPGNVRELENCLTRATVVASGGVIRPEHLDLASPRVADETPLGPLSDVEREYLARVLRATGGQKTRAAEILGVSRPRLNRLLHRYGME